MYLPMHLCGSIIKGMIIPRASRVEEVSATRPVPLDCSKKFVGNGRLCAPACSMSSGGKRMPRDGEVGAAMCPLASVYMSVAERGARSFWINNGQGVVISVCNKMLLPKEGIDTHLLAQ